MINIGIFQDIIKCCVLHDMKKNPISFRICVIYDTNTGL